MAELPNLRVSDNKRFLETESGEPFFYLADTAWELFHRLDREEAALYLDTRAAQGFTAIQAVALAECDGLNTPNSYGQRPLIDRDPARPALKGAPPSPDYSYWDHVDWIIDEANRRGLVMALLPTWGRWVKNSPKTNNPKEIVFDERNAETYGAFIGARYRNKRIVWVLGGDRRFEGVEEVWRAMARGIERGASGGGEPAAILMTLHPRGGDSSSTCFHDDDWLDFNMWQTGHSPINGRPPTWEKIARDYNRTPVKPVIDGEPLYEGIPIGFNRELYGHSTDAHVRQRAYWHVFAGACGHTYGHHSVWQMHSEKWPPLTFPILPWRQAIHCLGAQQMRHLKALILSRPYFSRVPDQTLIAGANPSDETHLQATRGDGYAFVYTPFGLPVAVRLGAISGGAVRAWWHNPRIGSAILIDTFDNRGTREFVPPSNGFGCDWTLVLDDASRDFPIPGAAE